MYRIALNFCCFKNKGFVFAWQVQSLRRHGWSFREIGEFFDIPKGTAYRLSKKTTFYWERVGNKKKGRVRPIWKYISPDLPYRFITKIFQGPASSFPCKETLRDYLLDFAYSLDLSKLEQPEIYLWVALKRKCYDFLRLYEQKKGKSLQDFNNIQTKKEDCYENQKNVPNTSIYGKFYSS